MRKKIIFKLILLILLFSTFYISYNINLPNLSSNTINFFKYKFTKEKSYLNKNIDIFSLIIKNYKMKYQIVLDDKSKKNDNIVPKVNSSTFLYNDKEPIVYIYNTHTNEEYTYKKNNLYNITPTVMTASFILKDELSNMGIGAIVEENNVSNKILEKKLAYGMSYKISREFLENKFLQYPSLIYFIDLHRDSVNRSITTVNINGVSYARTMFLLGLENDNYENNKIELLKLENYLNNNYKGISRGIYEKKGKGVNGIYNQDFSKYTMLIEVGGVENTIDEVANSIKVIALMLKDYINSNNVTNLE